MNSCYDINQLVQAAQRRWLKPAEVLFILQNHDNGQITQKAPQKPTSGSLFLFNKRVLRFFRKDGHNWRKKRDGRNVGEAHERLKVGNAEALNCYYAHGEDNPNFQRRSYWMLDPVYEHIVLVHYRDITEGKPNSGSILEFSPGTSYSFSNFTIQNQGTTSLSDQHASYQSLSSPVSVEVCSDIVSESHKIDHINNLDGGGKGIPLPEIEVGQVLRRLEEQLSLDDDRFKECLPFGNQSCSNFGSENQGTVSLSDIHGSYQSLSSTGTVEVSSEVFVEDQGMNRAPNDSTSPQLEVSHALRKLEEQLSLDDKFKEYFPDGNQNQDKDGCALPGCDIGLRKLDQGNQHNLLGRSDEGQARESLSWNDVFELSTGQSLILPHSNDIYSSYGRCLNTQQDKQLSSSKGADEELENYLHLHSDRKISIKSSSLIPQDFQRFNVPEYSFSQVTRGINTPGYYSILCESDQFQMPLGANSGLTIAQEQKFKITEISPEWGFANEVTKVIIIGSFLCNPSELKLTCMFGDVEVPVQIIQDGVLCCQAPPSHPGKVTLCITSGNREACSEVRGFEYINKHNACNNCINPQQENRKSLEELLLVVRLGQMLLSDSTMQKREGTDLLETDSWGHIMDDILTGSETSCGIMGKVLQEVMKDKLQQWLSSRSLEGNDNSGCALSKKEQGILHVIAGLGYEWALNSILAHGVGVNFRDINGWTALHWAARFGREKMVAALIAYGASPGAVTDPTEQDPVGKTPASIASACGHKGLAGYLSELALTTHLSSLTLEETELSKCSAVVEAEARVGNISSEIVSGEEDQQSMKQTLAAVRNAAQAAARIQSAFRAHSFRKRQLCETATSGGGIDDEYVFTSDEIQGLSAASKLVFRHLHDHNIAALSIQKNYRSWKGRKDFLALRQKVVKIQAHIRGYQVRKKYKVICWAVGIYDKVVLRWRRKGAGLRVYKPEAKSIDGEEEEEEEDEDILKSFRKQKVDGALNEAVSRVLSMVDCPEARQQYNRMLERFQEAKAELDILADEAASTSRADVLAMDSDDMYLYP